MDLPGLTVTIEGRVARATIDHPPINLLDLELMASIDRFGALVEADPDVTVVVLDSADPEFFIAHFDVGVILQVPRVAPAEPDPRLGGFHAMVDRFRTMPKATICVIEGIVRGGGCELASSFDMRFASLERAVLGQPEVPLGILPGGSGTQRLPWLVGRARALELVLGGGDVDAATAERWGLVNRALPDGELRPHVEELVARIAASPPVAVAEAKAAIVAAEPDPRPGMAQEFWRFQRCLADPESARRMERFLEVGGQTREGELDLPATLAKLSSASGS